MSMFFGICSPYEQHFLENKKPTFLPSISEQVYAAILESLENRDLFQNCQTYSRQILEMSWALFLRLRL